jgi:4'-phosphopantetheinyl transferase
MASDPIRIHSEWVEAPEDSQLRVGEVLVWAAVLDLPGEKAKGASDLLSPEERERAARFRFEKDQTQYTAARSFLRLLLGRYLRIDPRAVRFQYNSFGKPVLGDEFAASRIEFNLAHSKGLGLFAFTLNRAIGVDVEWHRPDLASMEIAQRFFAPEEVKVLAAIEPSNRVTAFFECWTRKEAFIKARGMGLSLPLDKFTVAFGPNKIPTLLTADAGATSAENWTLHDVSPAPGYSGAVAIEQRDTVVRRYRFRF